MDYLVAAIFAGACLYVAVAARQTFQPSRAKRIVIDDSPLPLENPAPELALKTFPQRPANRVSLDRHRNPYSKRTAESEALVALADARLIELEFQRRNHG